MRAASSSSTTHLFGSTRDEDHPFQSLQQLTMPPPPPPPLPGSSSQFATVLTKKKRNLPGNPSPEAEVIALSPRTLLATNRFVCEVCSKGFKREQNLQLHRRGHNLPWKLKQRNPNEARRRRVYLCPEPTCVHHDPSRPLGDLTGIKKHYFRKHCEKKWKCDRCSKRYAVQSDWKAHSKICGTREYRCDCGTLFSRRDSFLTHSGFCHALARENARQLSLAGAMGTISGAGQLFDNPGVNLGGLPEIHSAPMSSFRCHRDSGGPPPPANSDEYLLHSRARIDVSSTQFDVGMPQHHLDSTVSFLPPPPHQFMHSYPFFLGMEDSPAGTPALLHGGGQVFDGVSANNNNNSNLFNLDSCFFPIKIDQHGDESAMALFAADDLMGHHEGPAISSLYDPDGPPLLPQLSATALLQKVAQMGATSTNGGPVFLRDFAAGSAESSRSTNERRYQDMGVNSLGIPGGGGGGGGFHRHPGLIRHEPEEEKLSQRLSTRDFLGVHGSMMMTPSSTNNHNM